MSLKQVSIKLLLTVVFGLMGFAVWGFNPASIPFWKFLLGWGVIGLGFELPHIYDRRNKI